MRQCILLAVFSAAILLGCGGGGTAHNGLTLNENNPYAATYAGEFLDSTGHTGQFTLDVSDGGGVAGQVAYFPVQAYTGQINFEGTGNVSLNTLTPSITLGTPGLSTLSGQILYGAGNWIDFTVVTNPTGDFGGASPYAGKYAGTQIDTTHPTTGIVGINVSETGQVSGCAVVTISGVATISTISGTLSGTGALSYTVAANSVTFAGTVTQSGAKLSGALTGSNGDAATFTVFQVT